MKAVLLVISFSLLATCSDPCESESKVDVDTDPTTLKVQTLTSAYRVVRYLDGEWVPGFVNENGEPLFFTGTTYLTPKYIGYEATKKTELLNLLESTRVTEVER